MADSLLAHVVTRFAARQWENVATESLLYLLDRPAARDGLRDALRPLGFVLPEDLRWHSQAGGGADSGIPDLVADDEQGRHVLVVEAKFWATLTREQPGGYLRRQADQFAQDEAPRLLAFLAPGRRLPLLAAELAQRLGGARVEEVGPLLRVSAGDGRSLALLSWGALLHALEARLRQAQEPLDDLQQLRGLCDRADQEAVLPLEPEDVAPERARRWLDLCDLVDRVTDRLTAANVVDLRGLRATAAKGWYGRYMRTPSGLVVRLAVSAEHWSRTYPTPFWVRVWNASEEVEQAVRPLRAVVHVHRNSNGNLHLGLAAPLWVDEAETVRQLQRDVQEIASALPAARAPEPVDQAPVADEA